MKHNLQKILSELRADVSLRLSEDEKGVLESRLREYMACKPLPQHSRVYTYVHTTVFRFAAATLVLALLSTGSVSYAAEGALPGDTLYPVKVHVNENVRRVLAQTPEARAAVESELAARRLDEAHELVKQKRLTPALRAELEDDFDEHADRVEAETEALHNENRGAALEVSERFESKLVEREAKFEELDDDDSDEFTRRIDRRKQNIAEFRERVEEHESDDDHVRHDERVEEDEHGDRDDFDDRDEDRSGSDSGEHDDESDDAVRNR